VREGGGEREGCSEKGMYGTERNRGKRGCKSGVERYSEGECKRGEGRARESEREKKIELE
jgi:hypothetical protein